MKSRFFPNKCLNDNKIIKISDTATNTLIIGDDIIIGSKLFDCNETVGKKLSDLIKSNIYELGTPNMTLKSLYNFVKINWNEIITIKPDQIILCVGYNDIVNIQFNVNRTFLDKTIKLLKTITNNIYILSPRDIHNDNIFVFPFNHIIDKRVNKLYMLINRVANDNNIKIIDIKKDLSYLCKNGLYCRLSNNTSLDNNGITIISNIIKDNLVTNTK